MNPSPKIFNKSDTNVFVDPNQFIRASVGKQCPLISAIFSQTKFPV